MKAISRIRDSPNHIYECYCEVVLPKNNNKPWILQTYPENFDDQEVLSKVLEFACPFKEDELASVRHFSFVLTTISGHWLFGFSRFTPEAPTFSLLLSCLPWHNTFFKIINKIGDLSNSEEILKVIKRKRKMAAFKGILQRFLEELYLSPVPEPGNLLHLLYNKRKNSFIVKCDDHLQSPTIPEERNLTDYFRPASISNLITVFVSMLHERRIVMTSANLPKLSACIQAANVLLYPMQWQHIFITILPLHLIDYLHAPIPFLIGVPLATLNTIRLEDMGDVVLYNLDTDKVTSPYNDVDSIPAHIISDLKRSLKTPNAQFGDGVARAFLQALVHLIGGYREALKLPMDDKDNKITFDADAFLKTRPSSLKPFLHNVLTLQIFQQFIEGRLEMLNTGEGFSDRFELEVSRYDVKVNSWVKAQYKDWIHNVKKGGSLLKKMKNKSRRAYKDLRGKIQDLQLQQPTKSTLEQPQPHSAPSSPTQSKPRPLSLHLSKEINFAKEEGLQATLEDLKSTAKRDVIARNYEHLAAEEEMESELEEIQFEPINMDLMGDLQDLIFRRNSSTLSDHPQKKALDSACSLPPPPGKRKSDVAQEPLLIQFEEDDILLDPLESSSSPQSTFYCPTPEPPVPLDPFDMPPSSRGTSWQTFH